MSMAWLRRGVVGCWLVLGACDAERDGGPELGTSGAGMTSRADPEGSSGAPGGTTDTTAATSAGATSAAPDDSGGTTLPDPRGSTGVEPGSTGEPLPMGLPDVGSLVILGDSLGDGGGQPPYYYALLRDGLAAHYGEIEYVNRAEGGSETDALSGQVNGLPGNLPGPVVVVITSGGNDMKDNLPAVVTGLDAPMLERLSTNIDGALASLLAPGRFGPGVEVFVFEGNIYDASDGAGDFGQNDCNFAGGLPAIPCDPFFDRWNGAIREAVEARGQTAIDIHGHFYGHGYNGEPNWYASDCTHPNQIGHDALYRFVFEQITGEQAP